jgi:NAD(P)-dependent dehydrogenase (short-subunit alcohol dehydrogenase family)
MTTLSPTAPDLTGKAVIITGASRGIGAVAARTVAAAGATAVLAARDTLALAAVEREIIDSGGGALAVPADVGDPAVVERLVAQTLDACGRLDAAFNNAGENAGEGHRPPPSATSRSTTSTVSSGCISKGSSSA